MREDNDLTLSVAVRYWTHSNTPSEFGLLEHFLVLVISPEHVAANESSHPPLHKLFRDIHRGAGSFRKFFSNIESSLSWLVGKDAAKAVDLLDCLVAYGWAQTLLEPGEQPDFIRSLVRASNLWTTLCSLMTRTVKDDEKGDSSGYALYTSIVALIGSFLHRHMESLPNEGPQLVIILVRAGTIDALDITLSHFSSRKPEVSSTLTCLGPVLSISISLSYLDWSLLAQRN